MNLRSVTYVIVKEVTNRDLTDDEYGCEDENDITMDTDNHSEPDFDSSDDDEFDLILSSYYEAVNDFIDIDYTKLRGKLSL